MPKSEAQFKPPRFRDFDPGDRPKAHEWVRVSGISVPVAKPRPNRAGLVAALAVGVAAIAASAFFLRPRPAGVPAIPAVVTDYVLEAESEGTVYDSATTQLKLKGKLQSKGGTFDAQPTHRFEMSGSKAAAKVEWQKLKDDLYAFEATSAPPTDKKEAFAKLDLEFAIAGQKRSASFWHQWTFKEAATEVEKTQTVKIETEQRRPKTTSKPSVPSKSTEIQGPPSPKGGHTTGTSAGTQSKSQAEIDKELNQKAQEMEEDNKRNEAATRARLQQTKPPAEPPKANPPANATGGANPNGL
ncbi:MAG: hypothetical protein AMXMBFR81_31470 [Chthonomonas sp.]